MKSLNKKISVISKLVLLYSFLIGGLHADVLVSSDRFIIKILDRTVSYQDIGYQLRNLRALNCIYDDAIVIQYFERSFIKELDSFVSKFPKDDEEVKRYMHSHEAVLKKIRFFFKMLRYSEDQKSEVSTNLSTLIREGIKENKCDTNVLFNDNLRTNFVDLISMELYLRARYSGQLKQIKFSSIKPSIDLFVESIDKQFGHEYYW